MAKVEQYSKVRAYVKGLLLIEHGLDMDVAADDDVEVLQTCDPMSDGDARHQALTLLGDKKL
eukprot:330018-Alexandrium_andersonii.AAC.1